MQKILSAVLSASLVFGVAGAAAAADQTKLYDPMSEAQKLVIPMELFAKDGNTAIGNVVVVESSYGLVFHPNLKELTPGIHGFHVHRILTAA